MPNYAASLLSAAQARFNDKNQQAELRRKQDPALMLGLKNTEVTVIGHQALRSKDTRPVKAYLKKRKAAGAGTAKAFNHTGTRGDSLEVTLGWVKFVETFSIGLKQGQANVISHVEMLQHEIAEAARNLHARAGTYSQSYIQSNRTQLVSVPTAGAGAWNATRFALEVAAANKDKFYQNVASFMRKQNYRGSLDIIADSTAFRAAEFLGNQGNSNQQNLSFQFRDLNIVESTEDIDVNYTAGCGLVMPSGTFAILPWNDPANLTGKGDYDSTLGGFGTLLDPLGSGLIFDIHGYTDRADDSANGGDTQDEVLQMEISLIMAPVLSPLSTTNETVVYEAAQL